MSFSAVELIIKKRERFELSTEEIRWLVANYTSGVVADEQMSAMAMAILLNGMNRREVKDLTLAMIDSGERLEFTAEAGPGDFIYVPPYVPHQEINASPTEVLECVLCRSDGEAVAINLDIAPAEPPEQVLWVDPTHPHGGV